MGLFTNRKKDDDDVAGLSEAANMLARLGGAPEAEQPAEATMTGFTPADETLHFLQGDEAAETTEGTVLTDIVALTDSTALPHHAAVTDTVLADTPLPDASPASRSNPFVGFPGAQTADVTDAPRRRLEDRPRAQAGNVEIDAAGLLNVLGVDKSASLTEISEAHQKFVADHQPVGTDDADAAQIKKRIRREVNSAYASFRLTYAA